MTIQAQPATVFNDLMQAVTALEMGPQPPNEFSLRKLERDAESLKVADPAGKNELLASIAALRGDMESAIKLYERAISSTSDYIGAVLRYLGLLGQNAETRKVKEAIDLYYPAIRNDPAAVREASKIATYTGWLATAYNIAAEGERLRCLNAQELKNLADATPMRDVREEDVAIPVGFVTRYLLRKGYRAKGVHTNILPLEEGGWSLFFEVAIDASPEVITDLEWEMFGELEGENFPAENSGFLRLALTQARAEHAN